VCFAVASRLRVTPGLLSDDGIYEDE